MSNTNLLKLNNFREDRSSALEVIDGPAKVCCEVGKQTRLLVLDSSFNPPHWGHYTLIERAIEFYRGKQDIKIHLLLLLSIKNADKADNPAPFDKRLDMMSLFSKCLTKDFNDMSATVAVTKFAKFVEKTDAIRKELFPSGPIVYLVGFDTITRVLDPKYYLPQTLAESMKDFMKQDEFFCLTRKEDDNGEDLAKQLVYAKDITDGLFESTIPREWGSKITVLLNSNKYCAISSSAIRKRLTNFEYDTVKNDLQSCIVNYIEKNDKEAKKSIFT